MKVTCASPTCSATITIDLPDPSLLRQIEALEAEGWRMQRQAGDDTSRPYCGRDREWP